MQHINYRKIIQWHPKSLEREERLSIGGRLKTAIKPNWFVVTLLFHLEKIAQKLEVIMIGIIKKFFLSCVFFAFRFNLRRYCKLLLSLSLLLLLLCASTSLHLHLGQLSEYDVVVLVHVEQVDAGHLLWRATRTEVRLLDQVAVRVGGHDDPQAAVSGTEVGFVLGGVDDEGPAVLLLEVDGEGPEATVGLGWVCLLVADFAQVSFVAVAHVVLLDFKLDVRSLDDNQISN